MRKRKEIEQAEVELFDKVWHERHLVSIAKAARRGEDTSKHPGVTPAKEVERRYGQESLGPYTDFEWGMINGKLSALRWVLGEEWDFLHT